MDNVDDVQADASWQMQQILARPVSSSASVGDLPKSKISTMLRSVSGCPVLQVITFSFCIFRSRGSGIRVLLQLQAGIRVEDPCRTRVPRQARAQMWFPKALPCSAGVLSGAARMLAEAPTIRHSQTAVLAR